jgi:HK97 family phage major capsid protein
VADTVEQEFKAAADGLRQATDEVKRHAEETNTEIKNLGRVTEETKTNADRALTQLSEMTARLGEVEQKMARRGAPEGGVEVKSAGQNFVENEKIQAIFALGERWRGHQAVEVKAITSASSGGQSSATALRPSNRVPGIIDIPRRRMTIRNLLPQGPTQEATIDYARENVVTNNAAVVAEGALKPESNITYTMQTATTRVIAHWIPASKQVLSDAPMLQAMIDSRLRFGLEIAEEAELLMGDGTGEHLLGLMPQATAYAAPTGATVTGATTIDKIRLAMLQAALAEYPASAVVVNPIDWFNMETQKDGEGRYIIGNPQGTIAPTIWGLPVVPTQAMPVNNFLAGSFQMGAQIWDRWDASVLVSTEDRDNFVKNMVTILAEERLALTVYRPASFIKGTFAVVA